MKKSLIFVLSLFFFVTIGASYADARQINWLTNYDEAIKISRATSKPVILFFTGSDWCSWCTKLEDEVLRTPEFADMTADKFVFVKIDFPLNRVQAPETAAQNKRLQKQFDIPGFPTLVILDAVQQKPIGTSGYRPGGGKQYAVFLLKLVDEHTAYKQKLENIDKNPLSGAELKQLYEQAVELKRDGDASYIATVGANTDQKNFFLLERYRLLAEQGQHLSDGALSIRKQLLASDPSNLKLTHYQVAIIDFEAACRSKSDNLSSETTVASLVNYLDNFGEKDKDNRWRLQMLICQVFFENNNYNEALRYAQSSYDSAPLGARPEISTAISSLESKNQH